jgi:hypothetical protein
MSVQGQHGSAVAGVSTNASQRNEVDERTSAEQALRRAEAWFAGQKEAFQAAMVGASLETSLDILIRTAIELKMTAASWRGRAPCPRRRFRLGSRRWRAWRQSHISRAGACAWQSVPCALGQRPLRQWRRRR